MSDEHSLDELYSIFPPDPGSVLPGSPVTDLVTGPDFVSRIPAKATYVVPADTPEKPLHPTAILLPVAPEVWDSISNRWRDVAEQWIAKAASYGGITATLHSLPLREFKDAQGSVLVALVEVTGGAHDGMYLIKIGDSLEGAGGWRCAIAVNYRADAPEHHDVVWVPA